jgi:DnaA family protein
VLPIDAPHQPSLANFVVGDNGELCEALASFGPGFSGLWLCGEDVCGKSHLLQASCLAAAEAGHLQAYLDASVLSPERFTALANDLIARMRGGLDLSVTVSVDHVEGLQNDLEAEEVLMALYNALHDSDRAVHRRILVAHRQSAGQLDFGLADLNSRLRALAHHQLQPLTDEEKCEVLRRRAQGRGYHLTDAVVEYWLRRGPRGIDQLLADLERLDQATLQHKRLLTVPLLKSVLGY